MNADAIETGDPGKHHDLRVAAYFPPGERRIFGWLHCPLPDSPTSGLGLVLCNPFGYEGICAHRSMRAIAEASAELGIPSLRFDYQGTGDSAEIDGGADQVAVWTQDVISAIRELKRISGVERVCLLGVRLGGLLAIEAARQSGLAEGLILIEPVVAGVRYLREIRRVRLAASLGSGQPAVSVNPTAESIEVSGFPLALATVRALAQIDLMTLPSAPAEKVLIIDRMDLPSARTWCDAMRAKGADLDYVTLPGFVEMIMTPAESASIPVAMIDKIRSWLPASNESRGGASARCHAAPGVRGCTADDSCMQIPCDETGFGIPLTERAVCFGPNEMLFGIVTKPRHVETRKRAVIFLNTGAVHHVGSNRSSVSLARRWARHGYLSLRMDLTGIGDSETRPGRPISEVFPPTAVEEIREAIEFLRISHGITDISLVGTCSGATLALHAAIAGLPVKRIFLANPAIFFWRKPVTNSDITRLSEAINNPAAYRSRLLSVAHWKRLLRGQVRLGVVPRVFLHRLVLAGKSVVREVARRAHIHLPGDLGWELEALAARGVKILFVFAGGEPGLELLKIEAGSSLVRLGDQCRVRIIEGGDHSFSQQAPRSRLEEILSEELFAR